MHTGMLHAHAHTNAQTISHALTRNLATAQITKPGAGTSLQEPTWIAFDTEGHVLMGLELMQLDSVEQVMDPPPDLHPETAPHYVEVCCTSSKSFGSPPICNITLFPTNPAQPRSWLWGSGVCSLLGSSCRNHTSSSRWGTPCLSILPFPQSFEVHNQHTNLDRM